MATILVVDDIDDIRLLVKMTLEADGHIVRTADGGASALEAVAAERPDVIILDVQMPEVDGFTVLTTLKASEPAVANIPVIILSILSGPLERATGGIEGAVRYLTKPIDLDELRATVKWALEGPEARMRLQAQREALELLAWTERDSSSSAPSPVGGNGATTRLRLSGLERERTAAPVRPQPTTTAAIARLATLTEKQRGLLKELAGTETVIDAADRLGVSRSNVYASLRRISRKLGTRSVPELLALVRSGALQ